MKVLTGRVTPSPSLRSRSHFKLRIRLVAISKCYCTYLLPQPTRRSEESPRASSFSVISKSTIADLQMYDNNYFIRLLNEGTWTKRKQRNKRTWPSIYGKSFVLGFPLLRDALIRNIGICDNNRRVLSRSSASSILRDVMSPCLRWLSISALLLFNCSTCITTTTTIFQVMCAYVIYVDAFWLIHEIYYTFCNRDRNLSSVWSKISPKRVNDHFEVIVELFTLWMYLLNILEWNLTKKLSKVIVEILKYSHSESQEWIFNTNHWINF